MPNDDFKKKQFLHQWSQFVRCLRDFFQEREFLECHTPCVVASPGTEPAIDFFPIPVASKFLRSSPELHLKKILSYGEKKIFEIGPVFRREEWTQSHRPEFYMLEWYRAFTSLDELAEDVREMFEYLELNLIQENRLSCHFETYSIPDLFTQLGHVILPTDGIARYREIATALGLDTKSMETVDDFFFLIWTQAIEPSFNPEAIVFVTDYPPFQAAYAKIGASGWASRFEVYWRGLELGNAFDEITDVNEQRARFVSDNEKRIAAGKPAMPLDEDFLACLERYPPSAGIAMGVDRLFMAFYKVSDIQELRIY